MTTQFSNSNDSSFYGMDDAIDILAGADLLAEFMDSDDDATSTVKKQARRKSSKPSHPMIVLPTRQVSSRKPDPPTMPTPSNVLNTPVYSPSRTPTWPTFPSIESSKPVILQKRAKPSKPSSPAKPSSPQTPPSPYVPATATSSASPLHPPYSPTKPATRTNENGYFTKDTTRYVPKFCHARDVERLQYHIRMLRTDFMQFEAHVTAQSEGVPCRSYCTFCRKRVLRMRMRRNLPNFHYADMIQKFLYPTCAIMMLVCTVISLF